MSIRHLDSLFSPESVAVFGASEREGRVGSTVWRNLLATFPGRLYPVNPKHRSLGGVTAYGRVKDLPEAPELAVICTPAASVPGLIAELAERGTRAAVVVTAGLDKATKQAMLDAARPHTLRILGPNCIGLLVPHKGLNASFAHIGAQLGELAFVSQSGALVTAMRNPGRYRSVSAFAPICDPSDIEWGANAFSKYLGADAQAWRAWNSVALIEDGHRLDEILIDQGDGDEFLESGLRPWLLEEACKNAGIPLTLRMQPGYDHSYYFISTFMADHIAWHAERLKK